MSDSSPERAFPFSWIESELTFKFEGYTRAKTMTGVVQEQKEQIEKHMGCMGGFLQIFDRNQILAGKRLYATKRLPPSTVRYLFLISFLLF